MNPSLQAGVQSDFGKRGDRELYVDKLIVFREWGFGMVGPYLSGVNRGAFWEPDGWTAAHCYKGGWTACPSTPSDECSCGLYGWYKPDRVWEGPPAFFGAAEVSGTCVLGSLGLRAERMRPLAMVWHLDDESRRCPCGCGGPGRGGLTDAEARQVMRHALPEVALVTSTEELLRRCPPSDWESIVGPIPPYEPPWQRMQISMEISAKEMQRALVAMTAKLPAISSTYAALADAVDVEKERIKKEIALELVRTRPTGPPKSAPFWRRK
jgi:hypothetical protein